MIELLKGYVVEMKDGTEVRFDDGMEAYRYVCSLEAESWARLYGDVDRKAEREYYARQAQKVFGNSSKIESAPPCGKPSEQ